MGYNTGCVVSNLIMPNFSGLDIAYIKRPIFNNLIQQSTSGKEFRANYWSYPRYAITLQFNFLRSKSYWKDSTQREYETLTGWLTRMAGSYDNFLISIPDDNSVTDMPFGLYTGSTSSYQLQRSLIPSASYVNPNSPLFYPNIGDGFEPIFDYVGTPVIKKSGNIITPQSISSSGLVTVTGSGEGQLTWTGSYYFRVRFDEASVEFNRILNGVWEATSVTLVSVK